MIYITGGDLFTKKGGGRMESPLLRHPEGTGPSLFSADLKYIYITGGDLFTKKGSGRMESPLLRHPEGTGPSLFSAELKSKYIIYYRW